MADLQAPNAGTPITRGGQPLDNVWFRFFAAVAKRLSGAGNVAVITTADAANAGETQDLANELKAKVNEILQTLRQ